MHNHAAILTIDLAALTANWRMLAQRSAPGECAAVVKANAYGLGIETAVPALAKAGCRTFFVAHLSEAIRVRAAAPDADIFVLNGLSAGQMEAYTAHRLAPVLGSMPEIEAFLAASNANPGIPAPALHVDTGMNRLGLRPDVARDFIAQGGLARLKPGLVMSHFVSAETPDDPVTATQIATMTSVVAHMESHSQRPRVSLCNSSGLFLDIAPTYHLCRPGYALYGGNPTPGKPNPMQPVIRLESSIVQIHTVLKGERVGYNGNFLATRDSRIATISCGYADGFPRNAGAKPGEPGGIAILAGREVPFAGNVSMDLITLDITDVPEGSVKPGDLATLIGDSLDIDRVGASGKTSGYEILTNLGQRYQRIYVQPE